MKRLRTSTDIPIYFMTYYNIPFVYGLEAFCKKAKEAGCSGCIIPDIPFDEEPHTQYLALCEKYNITPILIATPLTTDERLAHIGKLSKGMVYCVSGTGVTGKQQKFGKDTKAYLDRVRAHTKLPLALGFGVQTQKDIEDVLKIADIAVIGSQMIRLYDQEGLKGVEEFLKK